MRRGQRTASLAQLERELSELDARRQRLVKEIQGAVERLTFGSAAPLARPDLQPQTGGVRKRGTRSRRMSADVRAKLSQLAKERWAKAKKAGKTRLG